MGSPLGIRRRVRAAIEAWVPWFDRATEERQKAAMRKELEAARLTREVARQTMMRDGYSAYAERLRGGKP